MNWSKPKTVLVVDDESSIVLALSKRLSQSGFHVLTATNADEALAVARRHHVDAMTLDVALGGSVCGLDVAQSLNNDPQTSAIPIIFVTGNADAGFREAIEGVGGAYFLAKPYDGVLLARLLDSIFAKDELAEVQRLSFAKRRQPVV